MEMVHTPERYSFENKEQYRNRRKLSKAVAKRMMKGVLFWDSAKQRTYVKPKNGERK